MFDLEFISNGDDLKTDKSIDLYKQRALAIEQKIEKVDLAKVFFLLNGKRGYQSNRKTNDTENDSTYLSEISDRDNELVERNITIGQKLYELLEINSLACLKNRVYSRKSYNNEFDSIWKEQSKHYPKLTKELKKIIKDEIIFYQRDLKSQKGLLSECEFEKHHKVIPASSPLFQEFRIWQRLHDLVIKNRFSEEYDIDQGQKECLFDKLQESSKLTDKNLLKELGLNTNEYSLNFKKIEGNTTRHQLLEIFEATKYDIDDVLQLDCTTKGNEFDKQSFMQLWHLIYSAKNSDHLIKNLKTKFSFNYEQAKTIADQVHYQLKYGSLSARAIRKILPYMQQGYNYTDACEQSGYRHSNWRTNEEKENWKPQELKLLQKNSLRNPVVEKVMNQLVNVVNSIIKDESLGRPDEIRIEMARELRMNAKNRKKLTSRINDSTKKHETIRRILRTEFNIPRPSRNDIIKYKLAEETNWISLYSGNPIQPSRLFTQDYDIEHIIPKARLFDDSFLNKTLCESVINREKGNKTAFDYMSSKDQTSLNSYVSLIKGNKKMHNPKKEKLLITSENIPEGFINRQLSDTQYIAKKAIEILSKVSKEITHTSGSITDLLKGQWELPYVIQDLNLEKYREIGQTELKDIKTNGNKVKKVEQIFHLDKKGEKVFWSKRDDHRHHALDAIVVALTKQHHIHHLNTLNASFEKRYNGTNDNDTNDNVKIAAQKFEMPWRNLREDVKQALGSTLISFKQKNKVVTKNINKTKTKTKNKENTQITFTPRGQLHKEFIYGKIKQIKTKPIVLNRRFLLKYVELIVDEAIKNSVKQQLQKFNNDPTKAFDTKTLKNNPLMHNESPLKEVICYEDVYVIRKPIDETLKIETVIDKGIQAILKKRLDAFEGNKKLAFSNLDEKPIYLNKNKTIEIKRVKIKSKYSDLLEVDRGYVNSGNNHHIAIYKDENDKIHGEKVSFIEAVERVRQGVSVINKQHKLGWDYLFNLQINDYFIFYNEELTPEIDLLNKNHYSLISKNLFRVQKLSIKTNGQPNFVFRHHLETTLSNVSGFAYKEIQSYGRLIGKCQKVQLNNLGELIKIDEYQR